jgi:hypothetical protein
MEANRIITEYKRTLGAMGREMRGAYVAREQQVPHSSINITAIYLQFNDKDVQEAYANVPF